MAVEKLTGLPIYPYMRRLEGTPYSRTLNSTVIVKGVIAEVNLNYVTYGLMGFHYYVLPALFVLNVTATVWVSDAFGVPVWDNRSRVKVAYDHNDFSQFSVGQLVEVKGWWEKLYDTTFSMMIVVGPYVNESYLQLV